MCFKGHVITPGIKLRPKDFSLLIIRMTAIEGRIYRLNLVGIEEVCYIGSTTLPLSTRYSHHKYQAVATSQKKCAASVLFEDGNEVEISLLEEGPFESVQQMGQRERWWIEQHPDCVNKNIPGRGWKERWIANREHNLVKHKEWLAKNADYVAAYRAGRAESERQQQKARYDAGYKEKRNAAKKVRVKCDICEKEMAKNSLWTHKATVHKASAPPTQPQ